MGSKGLGGGGGGGGGGAWGGGGGISLFFKAEGYFYLCHFVKYGLFAVIMVDSSVHNLSGAFI